MARPENRIHRLDKGVHMSKEFLTSREVATAISLSLGTVQKMIDNGDFKYFTTDGGHRRVLASSVTKYLAKRKKQMGLK
jgi:excisionase family DNA binding protein